MNSEFRVRDQIPDGTICNEIGRRIWRVGDGSEYEMLEIECPEFDAKGWVHLNNTDQRPTPAPFPSPTDMPAPIGTAIIHDPEGKEQVRIITEFGTFRGFVPDGSVCNILKEETWEYYSQGEYLPLPMYSVPLPGRHIHFPPGRRPTEGHRYGVWPAG